MVATSTITNNTITYTKTKINNKKAREGKIVSPVNYTVKTNISVSNQSNENEIKSINDLVEYINSDNGKQKKNKKKKKNLSKKKKNNIKKSVKTSTSRNNTDNNLINKTTMTDTDSEIEEFKRKIKNQSINANLVEKIKPSFSEKWLKSLMSTLDY